MLEEKLALKIGVKQLDFTLRSLHDYKSSTTPRLADYDTKYGHIALDGSKDPTSLMPDYETADIPLFEGSWLLRNRGIGLLLAYFYLNRDKIPDCQATDNFYIEINKALLAMGDALFIINNCYHHSYQRRLDSIDKFSDKSFDRVSELINLYKLAAEHKLRPKNNIFNNFEAGELWHLVTDLYIDFFIYYETKRQKIEFSSIEHYVNSLPGKVALRPKEKLRVLYEVLVGNTKRNDIPLACIIRNKNINLGFTLSLLACLHDENKHKELLITIKNISCSTDKTCVELCKKYLLLSHPSGELIRYLKKSNAQDV